MSTFEEYLNQDRDEALEEYIREREAEYRELAEADPEVRPLIDAMLEDVVGEGVES